MPLIKISLNINLALIVKILILPILSIASFSQVASAQETSPITNNTIPDNSQTQILNSKGESLSSLGKCDQAIIFFEKALDINSNDVRALDGKGSCLYHFGKYNEATIYLDRALKISPADTSALKYERLISSQSGKLSSLSLAENKTSSPVTETNNIQQQNETTAPEAIFNPALPMIVQQQLGPAPVSSVNGSFIANGTIHSLIYTSTPTKWIATGTWNMIVQDGKMKSFGTNMKWFNSNGSTSHTHQLKNFSSAVENIALQRDRSVVMRGDVEVGTNGRFVWHHVPATIDIEKGTVISISLDNLKTNRHFAGQPLYGLVTTIRECSDEPGPDMEVLSTCT